MISFLLCTLWIDIRNAQYPDYHIWCHLSPGKAVYLRSTEQGKGSGGQELEWESRDPASRTRSTMVRVILDKTVPIFLNMFLKSFYVEILWHNWFSPCSTATSFCNNSWRVGVGKQQNIYNHNIGMEICRLPLKACTSSNLIFLIAINIYMYYAIFHLTILSVQIHTVMQSSPPSISRIFFIFQNWNSVPIK